ncbi:MAG: GTP-binding protein [Candidatus Heimdallarchaeum aukensis]|uniref:GTP-binding protein n=1 Tax=Candidatus Heimdallarchaeum aukensis TaxID=2876573 RepID=A0A9Y1BME3_9ARCH|nr:MAG: GTP-binding protein [Candidatus Heimdallarchaeum aukensis]
MSKKKISEKLLSFEKKGIPLVILGLPNAGKTTFVNRILTGKFTSPKPTMGVQLEQYELFDLKVNIFDLGGQEVFRKTIWENYIKLAYGIIFIIDSSDRESLLEAKEEFWKSIKLKDNGDEFLILFLCNKADLENSMNLEEIINTVEIYNLAMIPNASFQFFKISMQTGENFDSVLYWLQNQLSKLIQKRKVTPESFLLADRDGLPILSISKKKLSDKISLYSGFLSAIQTFAKKTFNEQNIIQFIMSKDYKFILRSSQSHIFGLVIKTDESHEEARRLLDILADLIDKTSTSYDDIKKYTISVLNLDADKCVIEHGYINQ